MIEAIWFLIVTPALFGLMARLIRGRAVAVKVAILIAPLALSLFAAVAIVQTTGSGFEAATPRGAILLMRLNMAKALFLIPSTILLLLALLVKAVGVTGALPGKIYGSFAIIWIAAMIIMGYGKYYERFNFRVEEVTIKIDQLPEALNGLKIVHLSDMHLGSFHRKEKQLGRMTAMIDSLEPDLIFNTGDFITLGHKEFGEKEAILSGYRAKYGKFAVLGNHDIGTYLDNAASEDIDLTIQELSGKIEASGYTLLNNESVTVEIGGKQVLVAGVETRGRHPEIVHFEPKHLIPDSTLFPLTIMASHDPNHWDTIRESYPEVDITLSGHTHGMQFGILAGRLRWSPSARSYPRWNGLYREGERYLYVNRGIGVLGLPIRVGMPPEITILRIEGGNYGYSDKKTGSEP